MRCWGIDPPLPAGPDVCGKSLWSKMWKNCNIREKKISSKRQNNGNKHFEMRTSFSVLDSSRPLFSSAINTVAFNGIRTQIVNSGELYFWQLSFGTMLES